MKKTLAALVLSALLVATLSGCIPFYLFAPENDTTTQPDITTQPDSTTRPDNRDTEQNPSPTLSSADAEIRYNTRYVFEQMTMPQMLADYEENLIEAIDTSDTATLNKVVLDVWNYITDAAARLELNSQEEEEASQGEQQERELLDRKRLELDLGTNHIVAVTVEEINRGENAVIIQMRELDEYLLCTYIGIVHTQDEGLRYFTLERTYEIEPGADPEYMFCFVNGSESRGSIDIIDNNKDSFMKAIREAIA